MLRRLAEYTKLQNGLGDTEQPRTWSLDVRRRRGAEVISNKYKKLNLNSHVYVTSSTDPSIPPGIHRLLVERVPSGGRAATFPTPFVALRNGVKSLR